MGFVFFLKHILIYHKEHKVSLREKKQTTKPKKQQRRRKKVFYRETAVIFIYLSVTLQGSEDAVILILKFCQTLDSIITF